MYSRVKVPDEWDKEDIDNYKKYLESLEETRDDKRSGYV